MVNCEFTKKHIYLFLRLDINSGHCNSLYSSFNPGPRKLQMRKLGLNKNEKLNFDNGHENMSEYHGCVHFQEILSKV